MAAIREFRLSKADTPNFYYDYLSYRAVVEVLNCNESDGITQTKYTTVYVFPSLALFE